MNSFCRFGVRRDSETTVILPKPSPLFSSIFGAVFGLTSSYEFTRLMVGSDLDTTSVSQGASLTGSGTSVEGFCGEWPGYVWGTLFSS
jgi:hypothetical protein